MKFFQKTLRSQIIFVFLLVFFTINVVITASNVKIKQINKKLNEDYNIQLYDKRQQQKENAYKGKLTYYIEYIYFNIK